MIHSDYLTEESMQQLQKAFAADTKFPSVVCQDFFEASFYQKLKKALMQLQFERVEHPGEHCYGGGDIPPPVKNILKNKELLGFLEGLLKKKIQHLSWRGYSFGWKDYWLLEKVKATGIDIIVDLSDGWNENAGGLVVYRDAEGNFRKIPASGNLLAVMVKKKGVQRYLQYINHYAGKQHRYLLLSRI